MSHNVLLIDDDQELLELLRDYLQQDGFRVQVASDGASGLALALQGEAEIVILDVMMPGMSGIQTLAALRAQSVLPVLMLTARGDDVDRILGLELGADDYVAKPCTPRELAARIRAILKRSGSQAAPAPAGQALRVGELVVWPAQRLAEQGGQALGLTSTEYNLFEVLVRNAGHVVSKAELSQQALGRPLARFDRSIDVHMSSIRNKLGKLPDGRSQIQTVIRQGYQLVVE
ncbi:two-component system, OmpR family, response regulator CpxR [Pseudomonas pohangensis]|jgi:DNA-binding response OmpR family regulator|uniref:Two-component system, OmpR family, response regulator CpxR n=1 Tax=Pseudomonas pohangensis TaxID=364197 RepID=A0A1H2FPJ3_9PSED|nr:response regulator transcription factor [Pseudomonas pohangensis]SDU09232.1 two-component system, OmpR family, response regulator CpxR [Pseudomonas pohangensis]